MNNSRGLIGKKNEVRKISKNKKLSRTERKKIGKQLAMIIIRLFEQNYNKDNVVIKKFYISKDKHNKGQIVKESYSNKRTITMFKDKNLNEEMKNMADILGQLHHETQVGFIKNKDIIDNARPHISPETNTVINIDIKDAFNAVDYATLFNILHKYTYLSREKAKFIADISTINGKLWQGNPIAPAIFNIATMNLARRLSTLQDELTFTQYADDLTFSTTRKRVSRGFINFIYKIMKEEGFAPNKKKTKITSAKNTEITGIIFQNCKADKEPKAYGTRQKALKNKLRHLKYISKFTEYADKKDKNGKRIKVREIIQGIMEWLRRLREIKNELHEIVSHETTNNKNIYKNMISQKTCKSKEKRRRIKAKPKTNFNTLPAKFDYLN